MGDTLNTFNFLGLALASFGLVANGYQLDNSVMVIMGWSSALLFTIIFFILVKRTLKVKKSKGSWF